MAHVLALEVSRSDGFQVEGPGHAVRLQNAQQRGTANAGSEGCAGKRVELRAQRDLQRGQRKRGTC